MLNHFIKTAFIFGIALHGLVNCFGQQLPKYSNYSQNIFSINPAAAGDDGATTITATARKDWVDFGSEMRTPQSFSFSAQTKISRSVSKSISKQKNNRSMNTPKGGVGLGATIFSDNSGALGKTSAQLSYAYYIAFFKSRLSFGLTASMSQLSFDADHIDFYDNSNEPMLASISSPLWIPDFNVGISLTTANYHIGISVLQVLQSSVQFGNSEINYSELELGLNRNWNAFGIMKHQLPSNRNWTMESSFLLKFVDGLSFEDDNFSPGSQLDVTLKTYYRSRFWIGASYRTLTGVVAMAGTKYRKYYLSYAFDYGFNRLTLSSLGSHEVILAVKFGMPEQGYYQFEKY